MRLRFGPLLALTVALLALPDPCHAYIGPGAGMVFLSSFLAIFLAFILAIGLIVLGAFRWLFGLFRKQKQDENAKTRRVVVIGLDGCSPLIMERMMDEGKLPNLAELRDGGHYQPLRTTCPPISPVAWSTFATGMNPGKHSIFDFLRRNPFTYQLELSSTRIREGTEKVGIGPLKFERACTSVDLQQQGKAFWEVLGENGIFSAVMRVPISYPPPEFNGVALSGMCAPDLLGTQGTFAYYTTEEDDIANYESGLASLLASDGNGGWRGEIRGPENPASEEHEPLTVPFELQTNGDGESATLKLQDETVQLKVGEYTDWVPVSFRGGMMKKIRGMTRFLLIENNSSVRLYQMPLNIDPGSPTMPIASPLIFSTYLQKAHGRFSTLGLAEDTWALNEGILSDQAFIDQCYLFHHERRKLLFDMLDKVRDGSVVFVFDITDRLQHMFLGRRGYGGDAYGDTPQVVEDVYETADELIGEVRERLDDDTVLMIMSDHGFGTFNRCMDLNRWLQEQGYLEVTEDGEVDWSRTRAYSMGLAGIYINQQGREAEGIVPPDEADDLKREIAAKLEEDTDPDTGDCPVRQVFEAGQIYRGIYAEESPDLVVGWAQGYRNSWDSVLGEVGESAYFENPKAWAADHCMHPAEVPGVFFCDRTIDTDDIWIGDIGPTVLDLLGVEAPEAMDGRAFEVSVSAGQADGIDGDGDDE